MGDIHGIIPQKLEILTENTGLQPILCATFAQLARFVQEKPPACAQAGDVIFLILSGFVFRAKVIMRRWFGRSIWWTRAK